MLRGLGGNDRLFGRGGVDRLFGGTATTGWSVGRERTPSRAGREETRSRHETETRDVVRCGPGRDTVVADRVDWVARDCETVRRR